MKKLCIAFLLLLLSEVGAMAQNTNQEGLNYLTDKQFNFARDFFQQQLAKTPNEPAALTGLANSYLGLQKSDTARILFRKLLDMDSKNIYAMVGLGQVAWLNHDRANESEYFERARRKEKNNPEVYCIIAEGCLNISKLDTVTALIYLKQGLDLFPKYAKLHHLTGDLEQIKKNYGNALNAYERAIFFDPRSAISYREIGSIHLLTHAYREALSALNKSIALEPEQILAYKYLGNLYYSTGRYQDAERSYQTYLERAEVSDQDEERFALTLFFNKKYQEAEKLLEQLNEINNDESILLRIKGYIAYETGEYQKGLELMNNYFKIKDPRKVIAPDYSYFGKINLKLGNEVLAIENFKKAILLDPDKTDIYEELAKLTSRNGMHPESAGYYQKMMEHGADRLVNNFLVGKEYYLEGEKWRSRVDSMRAVKKAEHNVTNDTSEVEKKMKYYYVKADSAFTVVSKLNSEYAGSYIWKGRIQSILDPEAVTTKAKEEYQRALDILDKSDRAKNQKSIIECYKYLGSYYYLGYERHFKSDKKLSGEMRSKAIDCFSKIKELDPEDQQAVEVLKKMTEKK